MAIQPTPDTLLRIQTEVNVTKAQHTELQTKVRQRKLANRAALEARTIDRAHRIREQLFTSPARHSAQLAAEIGVEPALLNAALVRFVRETLKAISKLRA